MADPTQVEVHDAWDSLLRFVATTMKQGIRMEQGKNGNTKKHVNNNGELTHEKVTNGLDAAVL